MPQPVDVSWHSDEELSVIDVYEEDADTPGDAGTSEGVDIPNGHATGKKTGPARRRRGQPPGPSLLRTAPSCQGHPSDRRASEERRPPRTHRWRTAPARVARTTPPPR